MLIASNLSSFHDFIQGLLDEVVMTKRDDVTVRQPEVMHYAWPEVMLPDYWVLLIDSEAVITFQGFFILFDMWI